MLWSSGKIKSIEETMGIGLAVIIGIGMFLGLNVMIAITSALNAGYHEGGGAQIFT